MNVIKKSAVSERLTISPCAQFFRRQDELQSLQAQAKRKSAEPLCKTEFNGQVVLTCPNAKERGCCYMAWYIREYSISGTNRACKYRVVFENLTHGPSCETPRQEIDNEEEDAKSVKANSVHGSTRQDQSAYELYTENDISLLKKRLEFESKGLLSKSTEFNANKDVVIRVRFKCKNLQNHSICPFLHILQYRETVDGQPRYAHHAICSEHLPECQLDPQNIQQHMTARKIDSSMPLLTAIIRDNPRIKPKNILEKLAQILQENDQNFLYEGLREKNTRRSIKKYFDNAVAKVKNKIKS